MARIVALDTGPVWMISAPHHRPQAAACQRWARDLLAAGVKVLVPEIVDYEVRRELFRLGATAGLARLERLAIGFEYLPLTTAAMRRAAELWAQARRGGRPTAHAQALEAIDPGDTLTVATDNVGHLEIWVLALPWTQIAP